MMSQRSQIHSYKNLPCYKKLKNVKDLKEMNELFFVTFRASGLADEEDAEGNVIPAPWRSEENKPQWEDFVPSGSSNNYSYEAREIRQEYKEYFNLEGAVSWQWRQCGIDKRNN